MAADLIEHLQDELGILRMIAERSGNPEDRQRCVELEADIELLQHPAMRLRHGA